MLKSREDAFNLLERLGAPRRLFKHLQLVGEVGGEIISKLDDLGVQYDKRFVQVGIAVHDAGKIVHPNELEGGGNLHEAAGEKLLLEQGVCAQIARCCRSHSQYASMSVSFEELLIALADTLWKGVRRQGFWNRWGPDLREDLAHLVGLIMRRICGEASAGFR